MKNKSKKRVAVVVVTYNRLQDLKICIDAIGKQTFTDFDIIVVNNGSTDGTKEYLEKQDNVISIHQDNVGGAGGFYTGMKYMYDNGYEWLLMMDDDGIPAPRELEELLNAYDEAFAINNHDVILNALVINKENRDFTAFLWARGSNRSNNIAELQKEKFILDIHPFNGTLIKREVIENIGFIKREMFIWGDEEEYITRARSKGILSYTVTSAIHYHPKEKGLKGYLLPWTKKYYILIKPVKMSHYYYRNKGYIYSTYKEKHSHIFPFLMANTVYDLTRLRFREIFKLYKYFYRGCRNNYN